MMTTLLDRSTRPESHELVRDPQGEAAWVYFESSVVGSEPICAIEGWHGRGRCEEATGVSGLEVTVLWIESGWGMAPVQCVGATESPCGSDQPWT